MNNKQHELLNRKLKDDLLTIFMDLQNERASVSDAMDRVNNRVEAAYDLGIASQAVTIAQLRELVKLAEEFHTDVMVATAVRGKEPNFTTANETWLKFTRAARALKGGE